MKLYLFYLPIFYLLGISYATAQSKSVDHYKTKAFDAVIFPENFPLSIDSTFKRFTPKRDEIDSAEKMLRSAALDTTKKYFNGDSALTNFDEFHRWYKDYSKQYFGLINKKGDKLLLINGFFKNDYDSSLINWLREPISSDTDYDAKHWTVYFNINAGKIFNLKLGISIYCLPQPALGIDHYKTNKFDAAIFSKDVGILADTMLKRFSPVRTEVDSAETMLRRELFKTTLDSNWWHDSNYSVTSDPFIQQNYGQYKKQYLGYIETNGDKILLINCFWNQHKVMDYAYLKFPYTYPWAGSYQWNVKYNIRSKKLFDYIWGISIICYNHEGIYHLKTNSTDVAIFPKNSNPRIDTIPYIGFTPTNEEVLLVENKLLNPKKRKKDFIYTHIAKYGRQYFGYIDKHKHKILYINSFCIYEKGTPIWLDSDWLNGQIDVCDGGECYWQVCYDLNTGKFFNLSVNGSA